MGCSTLVTILSENRFGLAAVLTRPRGFLLVYRRLFLKSAQPCAQTQSQSLIPGAFKMHREQVERLGDSARRT